MGLISGVLYLEGLFTKVIYSEVLIFGMFYTRRGLFTEIVYSGDHFRWFFFRRGLLSGWGLLYSDRLNIWGLIRFRWIKYTNTAITCSGQGLIRRGIYTGGGLFSALWGVVRRQEAFVRRGGAFVWQEGWFKAHLQKSRMHHVIDIIDPSTISSRSVWFTHFFIRIP